MFVKTIHPERSENEAQPAEPNLSTALAALRLAIEKKKVEGICNAYQVLRNFAGGMNAREFFTTIDRGLGFPATEVIVAAYSHRRCFMCDTGTVKCPQCDGAGPVGIGKVCPKCDGFGVVSCSFCGGKGWFDRTGMPSELIGGVLRRQLAHVQADLKRLSEASGEFTPEAIYKLPSEERPSLISWLIRLKARLIDLSRTGVVEDHENAHMTILAEKINLCLALLKRSA